MLGTIGDNPFYVLGLRPEATRVEVERQGRKLLGMLELGLASASTYVTPVGRGERTADKVRQAMAELRDPDRRLMHELWARLDPEALGAESDGDEGDRDPGSESESEAAAEPPRIAPWSEALEALGWKTP